MIKELIPLSIDKFERKKKDTRPTIINDVMMFFLAELEFFFSFCFTALHSRETKKRVDFHKHKQKRKKKKKKEKRKTWRAYKINVVHLFKSHTHKQTLNIQQQQKKIRTKTDFSSLLSVFFYSQNSHNSINV
jgi:hypothetical protein